MLKILEHLGFFILISAFKLVGFYQSSLLMIKSESWDVQFNILVMDVWYTYTNCWL